MLAHTLNKVNSENLQEQMNLLYVSGERKHTS